MRVIMVKMFDRGVEVPRRMLHDPSTIQHRGTLVIMDATDQGRHRPVKVARLMDGNKIQMELTDIRVVSGNDNRITFTGEERHTAGGKVVRYTQS